MHLDATPEMKELAKTCFGYSGRKYQVNLATNYRPQAYWDGGSQRDARLVKREGLEIASPSSKARNPYDSDAHATLEIPPGYFVLEHFICRGKDFGIRFYIRPDEADTGTLPAPSAELSRHEKIVMTATLGLKSSYAGIKNFRFSEARKETGITEAEYETAKRSLIERGFLNKAGAATTAGKNCREQLPYVLSALR